MLCAEWQSAHTGSSLFVWVTSVEWTLAVNSSKMPRWHCAQVRAMLARLTLERGSEAGSSWCAVWQSAQSAVTVSPLSISPFP